MEVMLLSLYKGWWIWPQNQMLIKTEARKASWRGIAASQKRAHRVSCEGQRDLEGQMAAHDLDGADTGISYFKGLDMGVREWESKITNPFSLSKLHVPSHALSHSLLSPWERVGDFTGFLCYLTQWALKWSWQWFPWRKRLFTRKSSQEKCLKENTVLTKLGIVLECDSSSETVSTPIKTGLLRLKIFQVFLFLAQAISTQYYRVMD